MAEQSATVAQPTTADWQAYAKACEVYYAARRERVGQNLNLRQAAALRAVPFLLNNHKDGLPGFKDTNLMPHGVANLHPDDMVESLWRGVFQNIRLVVDSERPAIEMVALCGEAGTFGQGAETKFEFWVIASDGVPDRSVGALEWKCAAIADWLQKSFRLASTFTVCRAKEMRSGEFANLEPDSLRAKAMPAIRDRFFATLFPLGGKMPLLHLMPVQGMTYDQVVQKFEAGEWANAKKAVDLGPVAAPSPVHLINDVLLCLKEAGQRLSDVAFAMALSLVKLRHGSKVLLADMVKRTFLKDPKSADPFEVCYDLIEAGLKDASKEGRFYLQQVYYLKLDPTLSKLGGKEPPPGSGQERAAKRVKAWGWSKVVVMSLDNITMWNYPQLLSLHALMTSFVSFAQEELMAAARKHSESGAAGEQAAALSESVSKEISSYFRVAPGKIMPVQPFTDSYYQTAEFMLTQFPENIRSKSWSISLDTPIGRRIDATKAQLLMVEACALVPQMLWMAQAGMLTTQSKAKGKANETEIPRPWLRELIEACSKLSTAHTTLKQEEINARMKRRDAVHFMLAANVCKTMDPPKVKSADRGGPGSTIGILGDTLVFDFEGEGISVLEDFCMAYVNGAGEIYAHSMGFRHHGLARAFALMLPHLKYDEKKEKLNVEFLTPPGSEGRKIREGLEGTLVEMCQFFTGTKDQPRRYLTRHKGLPYVYEKAAGSNEVTMHVSRSVPEMLNILENTGGVQHEVMVGSKVTGFERMRDLYAQAHKGALNLYFLRDNEPNQFHLIDETGAFSSDSFAGRGRSAFIGDTIEFCKRYAARKELSLHLFDIKKGRGRMVNFQVEPADIPEELVSQRSSKFTLGFKAAPDGDPESIIMNLAGQEGSAIKMSPEVLVKLKSAVKKMGNVIILDLPDVFPLPGGQSIPMTSAAVALKAAKRLRAMLLS